MSIFFSVKSNICISPTRIGVMSRLYGTKKGMKTYPDIDHFECFEWPFSDYEATMFVTTWRTKLIQFLYSIRLVYTKLFQFQTLPSFIIYFQIPVFANILSQTSPKVSTQFHIISHILVLGNAQENLNLPKFKPLQPLKL